MSGTRFEGKPLTVRPEPRRRTPKDLGLPSVLNLSSDNGLNDLNVLNGLNSTNFPALELRFPER